MKDIQAILTYDERTKTVEIRSRKFNTILMTIKLSDGDGTMTRIVEDEDCDNFWIGVKPTDDLVFNQGLFTKKEIIIKDFQFELK